MHFTYSQPLSLLFLLLFLLLAQLYLAPTAQQHQEGFWCQNWAVVSLHQHQTPPVVSLHQHQTPPTASSLGHWCLLVLVEEVAEGPAVSPGWLGVQHLDRNWYRSRCRFSLCSLQSWAEVEGRRNLGYLYALQHGAHRIMELSSSVKTVSPPPSLPAFLPVAYPASLVWSPGVEELSSAREQVPGSTISVLQSQEGQASLLAVGQRTFLPPSSPATLYLQDSLWTLLLPGSSAGWSLQSLLEPRGEGSCWTARGWLAQRLLWRLDKAGSVALGPAWVDTSEEEEEVSKEILQPGSLLDIELDCGDAQSCMTELYSRLARDNSSCISNRDVQLVDSWFHDLRTVGYPLPAMRRRRSFVYLTQGGELTPTAVPRLKGAEEGEVAEYDTFYMSFATPSGDLFFPNSTFQQGRNALLRLALARQVEPGYDYFIFTDEDLTLQLDDRPKASWKQDMAANPWRRFEEFLVHFQPKISFGQFTSHFVPLDQPFSLTSSHDEMLAAFHRSTLEFGLPLLESPLDYQGSWNEAYMHSWFIKIFYSRSSIQCNSVKYKNGGFQYHGARDEGKYIYKQGMQWQAVKDLLTQHIDMARKGNPLWTLLEKFDQMVQYGDRWVFWGPYNLDPGVFNMTDTTSFGLGFELDVFKFFNVCGSYFQLQSKWWKSGICRYLRSKKIISAMDIVDSNTNC